MNLELDFRSGIPIYLQVVDRIKEMIAEERIKPGDQLPTVRALATELRVNFNTVARAYRILDEAGIISTQQGRGTYILEMPPPETTEAMRQQALQALIETISERCRPAGREARRRQQPGPGNHQPRPGSGYGENNPTG